MGEPRTLKNNARVHRDGAEDAVADALHAQGDGSDGAGEEGADEGAGDGVAHGEDYVGLAEGGAPEDCAGGFAAVAGRGGGECGGRRGCRVSAMSVQNVFGGLGWRWPFAWVWGRVDARSGDGRRSVGAELAAGRKRR